MGQVQRDSAAPGRQARWCPSCGRETAHETRLRRGDVVVLVCAACGLASLVPKGPPKAKRDEQQS